jgi:predicted DCC family thiol-disulfide oxidoreductase YuxK
MNQSDDGLIVFFDGVCHLCQRSVQFFLKRDPKGRFSFAPRQGETAGKYLPASLRKPDAPDSFVVLHQGRILTHSAAAFYLLRRMPGAWPLLSVFRFLPKFICDGVYRFIARNRYQWFGKSESCMMPEPAWKDRFLA